MHNLSGVFIRQEKEEVIEGIKMFCFSLIFNPNKKSVYLTPNEEVYKTWIKAIYFTIGYIDILDTYEIGV